MCKAFRPARHAGYIVPWMLRVITLGCLVVVTGCGRSDGGDTMASEVSYAGENTATVQAALDELNDRLAALEKKVDDRLTQLEGSVQALQEQASSGTGQPARAKDITWRDDSGNQRDVASALASLQQRLDAVETALDESAQANQTFDERISKLEARHDCPEGSVPLHPSEKSRVCIEPTLGSEYLTEDLAAQHCLNRGGRLCQFYELTRAANEFPDWSPRVGEAPADPNIPYSVDGEWAAGPSIGRIGSGANLAYAYEGIVRFSYKLQHESPAKSLDELLDAPVLSYARVRCCYDR